VYSKESAKIVPFTNHFNSAAVARPLYFLFHFIYRPQYLPTIEANILVALSWELHIVKDMNDRKEVSKCCLVIKEVMEFNEVELF
jgi:hypothetical protein